MKGIDFVVDEQGRKKAAIIDLKEFGTEFEDFIDGIIATERLKKQKPKKDLAALRRKIAEK